MSRLSLIQENSIYLLLPLMLLMLFTACDSDRHTGKTKQLSVKQISKHGASSDRLKIIMDDLYSAAKESESSGREQKISSDEMADLIEAVEELLFNAELMTSGTPEFQLDENKLVTFRALAGQLYTEALNIKQLANNHDYRLIEPAYRRLNQTCSACHSLFRD